jgi:hypothetical protein
MFALGGADLASGFCLRTLSFGRPMTNMGTILDIVVVSRAVIVGTTCEESGRHVNMGLPHLLLCLASAHCFASSIVTPRGYKSE